MSVNLAWYLEQEDVIATSDAGSIRDRWMWGLRLLRDPDMFARGSSQLKPGRAEMFTKGAKTRGRKLSDREIRYRLQCARAYSHESQIRHACAEFQHWTELRSAGFPAYEPEPGEPVADHRTAKERRRDRNRAMASLAHPVGDEQLALFPEDRFMPVESPLRELAAYAKEMAELTARFHQRDLAREAYLARLVAAADGDLDVTWQRAHELAYGTTDVADLAVAA